MQIHFKEASEAAQRQLTAIAVPATQLAQRVVNSITNDNLTALEDDLPVVAGEEVEIGRASSSHAGSRLAYSFHFRKPASCSSTVVSGMAML